MLAKDTGNVLSLRENQRASNQATSPDVFFCRKGNLTLVLLGVRLARWV